MSAENAAIKNTTKIVTPGESSPPVVLLTQNTSGQGLTVLAFQCKWGEFFKIKRAISRRARGRNTGGTRASARRYPTEKATTK